jgi:hypothetical protein
MTILRTLARQPDEQTHVMQALWLMENHTRDWEPPEGGSWIDRDALDALTLTNEWMRPALQKVLDRLKDVPPAARPLWFTAGWFEQAEAWITDTAAAQGYYLLRAPEQFKHGTISSVIRAETDQGNVYFKAALRLPLFGNEPKLTAALGQLYPDYISASLAIDETRRWMLTSDFGTELRVSQPDVRRLETVVQTFARLQIQTAGAIDTLFAAGCLDRRLNVLASQIDGLLADEGCYSKLNDEEKAAWQALGPHLKDLCQQLRHYNIPYTLVHGDFHAGNIAVQDERVLFFDWTDACVAHPFFDLPVLIEYDAEDHAGALWDTYLTEWTAYESMERLREACEIAKILGALHQAVSYQGIYNGIEAEQQEGWEFGVPTFARRILKLMKEI